MIGAEKWLKLCRVSAVLNAVQPKSGEMGYVMPLLAKCNVTSVETADIASQIPSLNNCKEIILGSK
jgi:hypothetical protein